MFLTLQFPIADIRPFLQSEVECLVTPTWPTPEENLQFVRFFGHIRKRLLGGSGVKWMGDELYFCDASNAIRFGDLGSHTFPTWARRRRMLRRLFLHKPALARVEVSFALSFDRNESLTGENVIDRLEEILKLPTHVPPLDQDSKSSPGTGLMRQGRRIARLLRDATVPSSYWPLAEEESWTVRDGDPMLLVEYGRDEITVLPKFARSIPVEETHGFRISWMTAQKQGKPLVIWFLEASPGGESKVIRRQIRMCLLRLHLEYQALRLILNALYESDRLGSNPDSLVLLGDYLDEATRRVFRKSRFGVSQTPLYLANLANRELIREEYHSVLKSKLNRFKDQVRNRVERILAESASTDSGSARNSSGEKSGKTMTILFLSANPKSYDRLDIEDEMRCLDLALESVRYRDRIRNVPKLAVRPDDLIQHVRNSKPNVIHFSGHGETGGLVLRDESGGFREIDGQTLKSFLKDRQVELVVLNACLSKVHADEILEVVKAVIATEGLIDDDAAIRFTPAFYRALGNGLTIAEALRDGNDNIANDGLSGEFYGAGDLRLVMVD